MKELAAALRAAVDFAKVVISISDCSNLPISEANRESTITQLEADISAMRAFVKTLQKKK